MKKTVFAAAVILLAFAFSFPVFAEENYYSEIYGQSGADKIKYSLDGETRDLLDDFGIDPADYGWVNSLDTKNVFSHLYSFLSGGAKLPLKGGLALLGIILAAAVIRAFGKEREPDAAAKFAVTLAACGVIVTGVYESVTLAVNAIKGVGTFMLSFVPVYMGIVSVSGAPVSAAANGGIMLAAAEFISGSAAFMITALMGAYLSISVGACVSPALNSSGFAELFKKAGMWLMSLCTTVFLGLLGVKNTVNSAADSLSTRTAKFIIGTCVPVAGTALSGAVSTVSSSVALLKTSVGVYGIVALAAILLPVLAEILIWRLILNACGAVCTLFSVDETEKLLKAVDGMFAFLLGATLLTGATFIISLSVTVAAAGTL